jgi:hypothetical protein
MMNEVKEIDGSSSSSSSNQTMTGEDEGWEASKPTTAPWKSKSMARSTCCCCLVWVRLSHSFGRNYWH